MKTAIISDIHSNYEALQSTLRQIDELDVDSIVCLGDTVGYGAEPNECCELIRDRADAIVIGNHDAGACGQLDISWFNPVALRSLQWTADNLTNENLEWLKTLPYMFEAQKIIFTHAMLYKMEEFYYDDELIPIYYTFEQMEGVYDVSFIGHSHKYNILKAEKSTSKLRGWSNQEELELLSDYKYIVNVGSVGQPRDKVADSCFVILEHDNEKSVIQQHRVKYDIEATARKIIESGLPTILAERLFLGI